MTQLSHKYILYIKTQILLLIKKPNEQQKNKNKEINE